MEKARRFICTVCDAMQLPVIDRIVRLKLQDHIQLEVSEVSVALLERLESRFKATTVTNELTIDVFKILRVDVKN